MIERLEKIQDKYNEINEELMDQNNISNINKTRELLKEQSNLSEVVEVFINYKKILQDIEETKEMLTDSELADIAKEELNQLEEKKLNLEKELEMLLIPKDANDGKNVVLEIRGAAGGDEANIFAGDLYRMYTRYAEIQGWKVEVINIIEGTSGGFSQAEFMIKGSNVYLKFKYESGSHRVQRVPNTESQGRVHTSTATVLVMPEAEDVDIEIREADLKTDVYRSSGAGGQHVNTTDSAVRITHMPTGIVVTCQTERSQIKNKERAMKLLKTRIYEYSIRKQETELGQERRNKIGTGDRSEKIRTYNYPQNRVTDHRIGLTLNKLDRIMEGDLEEIIEALITEDQKRKLEGK
jgi:peptide chain release factor 1